MGSVTASIVDVNVDKGLPDHDPSSASCGSYPEKLSRGERSARAGVSGFVCPTQGFAPATPDAMRDESGYAVEKSWRFVDELPIASWIRRLLGL
jgi:hypothetical protein